MKSTSFVALESTVITHGLPRPINLSLAHEMERIISENGAIPKTVAVIDGVIRIGLSQDELEHLAISNKTMKISRRDIATAVIRKATGGTTVAGTMFLAYRSGIKVFATGGIGGVHELESLDISADLQALSDTPMIVVCAGAKAILDLPKTLEYLETMSVPVVGYRTDEFPAFYSRSSGLAVSASFHNPDEIVAYAKIHWDLGLRTAILVCQPLPIAEEIPRQEIEEAIVFCRNEARTQGIHGQSLTPYLLARLAELTGGASMKANIALLHNNARLAAEIAVLLQ